MEWLFSNVSQALLAVLHAPTWKNMELYTQFHTALSTP